MKQHPPIRIAAQFPGRLILGLVVLFINITIFDFTREVVNATLST